jgi:signal transduction histidine kinase
MKTPRRQFIVNWTVQSGYAANLLVRWGALMAVVGCCTVLIQALACAALNTLETSLTLRTAIWAFIGTSLILTPVLVWDSIKMSHRFVGPIVRMKAVIRGISEGKYQTIKLRESDYWHDIADELNRLQEKLKEREIMYGPSDQETKFREEELVACGD